MTLGPETGPTPAIPTGGRTRYAGPTRGRAIPATVAVPIWSLPIYAVLTSAALLGTVLGVVFRG